MIAWTLVVGCALVLAIPIMWRVRRRRFDPFEPIVLFVVAFGTMFVARPAAILAEDQSRFWGVDIVPTLPRALVLALLGGVAFVVAYEVPLGRGLSRHFPAPREIDERRAVAGALVTTVVALVALATLLPLADGPGALRVLLGGRGAELSEALRTSSDYAWYGSLLFAPAAYVLIALAARRRSLAVTAAACLVLALCLLRVGPVGGRIVLLPLVGGLLVLWYVSRDRRPGPTSLAALALAALLGSYLILHVRDQTDQLTIRTALSELDHRPQAVLDPVLRGADSEMVLALSAALTVIPDDLSHRWGSATIGNLAIRPVPRELWPEKPLTPGERVVVEIWPHLYPGLNPAFSPLLSPYWDFGVVGVAVGMALFGLVARTFWEWFLGHRTRLSAQLVFSTGLWFVVIGARNDPGDTAVLGAFLVGPVVAIVALASSQPLRARLHAYRAASARSDSAQSGGSS